jgi:hypothetical protein
MTLTFALGVWSRYAVHVRRAAQEVAHLAALEHQRTESTEAASAAVAGSNFVCITPLQQKLVAGGGESALGDDAYIQASAAALGALLEKSARRILVAATFHTWSRVTTARRLQCLQQTLQTVHLAALERERAEIAAAEAAATAEGVAAAQHEEELFRLRLQVQSHIVQGDQVSDAAKLDAEITVQNVHEIEIEVERGLRRTAEARVAEEIATRQTADAKFECLEQELVNLKSTPLVANPLAQGNSLRATVVQALREVLVESNDSEIRLISELSALDSVAPTPAVPGPLVGKIQNAIEVVIEAGPYRDGVHPTTGDPKEVSELPWDVPLLPWQTEVANPHENDGLAAAIAAALAETREAALALRMSLLRHERTERTAAATISTMAQHTQSTPLMKNNDRSSCDTSLDIHSEAIVAHAERQSVIAISQRLRLLEQALFDVELPLLPYGGSPQKVAMQRHTTELDQLRSELFVLREAAKQRYLNRALQIFLCGRRRAWLARMLMCWIHHVVCKDNLRARTVNSWPFKSAK